MHTFAGEPPEDAPAAPPGAAAPAARPARTEHPTVAEAFGFWLKLGFIGFGGPTGQIAIIHRERVEKRRLARYFRTTPEIWMRLQVRYDIEKAQEEIGEKIDREVKASAAV